ncbi:hypothetical protein [Zhengella mangrovi]|uniref:hypothetical protein n=1 Tax=Zhengella mangrovi TaxID=1982044 RepID=UPI0013FDAACF|nr:hypothetical protein [Zhengella mangrovi]
MLNPQISPIVAAAALAASRSRIGAMPHEGSVLAKRATTHYAYNGAGDRIIARGR